MTMLSGLFLLTRKTLRHVLEHRYNVLRVFVEVRHSVWLLVSVIGKDKFVLKYFSVERRRR